MGIAIFRAAFFSKIGTDQTAASSPRFSTPRRDPQIKLFEPTPLLSSFPSGRWILHNIARPVTNSDLPG